MSLSRDELSAIAHFDHPIACPFSDARVEQLLQRLAPVSAAQVLDIGCGRGEWLARLLTHRPDVRATGVDLSQVALGLARARLANHAVTLVAQPASDFLKGAAGAYDAVLCNGSTHALGGLRSTLQQLRGAIAPGGTLLVSDGYWQQPPSSAACDALRARPTDFVSLQDTVALAISTGYRPLYVAHSDEEEWDDYEQSWCGALERYVADHPELPADDAQQIVSTSRAHRDAYFNGYRGTLGFVAMLLQLDPLPPSA